MLSGPGAGKTRVIAHRIAYLMKNMSVPAREILAVTFTNKAAREMKKRVAELVGEDAGGLWVGTFHATCLRILKAQAELLENITSNFVVYDRQDQLTLLKKCMRELDYGETLVQSKKTLSRFDLMENELEVSFEDDHFGRILENLYIFFKKELVKANAMTFNDLLLVANSLLSEKPEVLRFYQLQFSHVLVDEYQDTNVHQHKFIELLCKRSGNIFAVGDENQSVYGWRGAKIENILNFEKNFRDAKIVKLERNYRSTKTICAIANGIIKENVLRKEKRIRTENPVGKKAVIFGAETDREEALFVAGRISEIVDAGEISLGDVAVLYRANFQSRAMEEAFGHLGIPYVVVSGVGFYQRAEIKDILAYMRLIQNPDDRASFERIINVPPRRIGKSTVEKVLQVSREMRPLAALNECVKRELLPRGTLKNLENFADMIKTLSREAENGSAGRVVRRIVELTDYMKHLGEDLSRIENVEELIRATDTAGDVKLCDFLDRVSLETDEDRAITGKEKVSFMTVHAAKGLEFSTVFLIGMNEGLFPHKRSSETLEGLEEERRLFYVAVTRAEKRLFISYSNKDIYSKPIKSSMFLKSIPLEHRVYCNRKEQEDANSSNQPSWEIAVAADCVPDNTFQKDPTPESPTRFSRGQRVIHKVFGPGIVKRVEGDGSEDVVTTDFFGHGTKKILADYLAAEE